MKYLNLLLFSGILFVPIFLVDCRGLKTEYISTGEALGKSGKRIENLPFLIFPETRENPVRWSDSLKTAWIKKDYTKNNVLLDAQPGEFFVFQVGIWAFKRQLDDIDVKFSPFISQSGDTISTEKITCFNKGGINKDGFPFNKKVGIGHNRVQTLWIGIDLYGFHEGIYEGDLSVLSGDMKQSLPFILRVHGHEVPNHGFDNGRLLSRLAWLNTTTGIDHNVTKGYIPVSLENNRINILGRSLELAPTGLPSKIRSYFETTNQYLMEKGESITASPFRFVIEKINGEIVKLKEGKLEFLGRDDSEVSWQVTSTSDEFVLICKGKMEFDGFADFNLSLHTKKETAVKDIRLEIPVNHAKAKYMMGLGYEGGLRPSGWRWNWDIARNQDMLWIGDVNGGMRIKWKAENYIRPLINVYYSFGPLNLPTSWGNGGKGGVTVNEESRNVFVRAFSGKRELKAGNVLNFDFELLITPLKVLDKKIKFGDRYFHGGGTRVTSKKIKLAEDAGVNIINIHHAEDIYPFINYPYLDENVAELKQLINTAHEHHLRLKLYYTTRELTKNLPEFWAFKSLNGEIIFPGPGNETVTAINKKGPAEWLKKNLRENYIPAWYNTIEEGKFKGEVDLSVITTPDSRLNNFYIGGLDWMVRNLQIDGLYIDDAALDRITVRRARKIIDQSRPEGRIDFHSVNHFNKVHGFANCLNLYMDLLPYFDLVWIGEGRDYDRPPDHWLIEVSGIPFGLSGQMLQNGGNPWRGMVYGITNRKGWGGANPSEIWKFWDDYAIADKSMIGYWDQNNPVKVSNDLIKATLYKGDRECIIAVANWKQEDQFCSVDIDWKKLNIKSKDYTCFMPAISGFQENNPSVHLKELRIPGGKGFLIVLRSND